MKSRVRGKKYVLKSFYCLKKITKKYIYIEREGKRRKGKQRFLIIIISYLFTLSRFQLQFSSLQKSKSRRYKESSDKNNIKTYFHLVLYYQVKKINNRRRGENRKKRKRGNFRTLMFELIKKKLFKKFRDIIVYDD